MINCVGLVTLFFCVVYCSCTCTKRDKLLFFYVCPGRRSFSLFECYYLDSCVSPSHSIFYFKDKELCFVHSQFTFIWIFNRRFLFYDFREKSKWLFPLSQHYTEPHPYAAGRESRKRKFRGVLGSVQKVVQVLLKKHFILP